MRRFRLVLLPALALVALLVHQPARANGIDPQKWAGKPGERIEVVGHDWLTCWPPNTPVEHVELFLLTGSARIRLFDVPPIRDGAIEATFEVPSIPAGTYRLEACSRGPELSGVAPGSTCLPVEGGFTVLAGRATDGGGSALGSSLTIGTGVALVVAVVTVLLYRRWHASRSST